MYQVLAANRYKDPFKVQGETESLEKARKLARRFTEEHLFVCHERDIHIHEEGKFLEYAGPSAPEDGGTWYPYRFKNT